jgi:hypothetical protein
MWKNHFLFQIMINKIQPSFFLFLVIYSQNKKPLLIFDLTMYAQDTKKYITNFLLLQN